MASWSCGVRCWRSNARALPAGTGGRLPPRPGEAQLTFLVGPNRSGKSNFLDALRLVSDSFRHSLGHAAGKRGGYVIRAQ